MFEKETRNQRLIRINLKNTVIGPHDTQIFPATVLSKKNYSLCDMRLFGGCDSHRYTESQHQPRKTGFSEKSTRTDRLEIEEAVSKQIKVSSNTGSKHSSELPTRRRS
ncbi:uncharacterized protein LOC143354767 [Halictus rubicundus]|uniref:uncharacterized protein LOC143354767 n=1 Tax=Halictus rubicundus TaxID=77578 RepID=UPI0040366A72